MPVNRVLDHAQAMLVNFENKYKLPATDVDQGSEEWLTMRLGVVSASNVSKALAKKGSATRETYMASLIGQVCTGYGDDINSKFMDWGKTNEGKARAYYELQEGEEFIELPFVFKDTSFRFGASPDGVTATNRGLEIKCPYATENHIKTLLMDKIKPEYQYQMQYTMWVMGVDTYDFCSFDPRMKKKSLCVVRVERDEKFFKRFTEELPEFIQEMDKHLATIGVKWGDQWTR